MPPWLALVLGLMVAGALALAFPFRSLEEQIARDPRSADPLQIAYLQAWLKLRADRPQLRYLLARQLADARDYVGARQQLALLEDSPDEQLRHRVLLLDIDIALREMRAAEAADAARAQRLLRARLARSPLPPAVELELSQRAIDAGAGAAALQWFERLLARDAELPAATWARAAQEAQALGEPRLAARLHFAAMAATRDLGERRAHFIAALRALQGANLLAEALAEADRYLGPLAYDTETLAFLTRLALAANRPDLAQRYAQMMIRLSLLDAAIALAQAQGRAVPRDWLALAAARPLQIVRVQATPSPDELARTPRLPFNDPLYQLAYQVFLANSNLRDALAVAQSAVRQAPGRLDWRRKLAQVADWSGRPELALEQLHAIARATGSAADWAEVQKRAPQVFDTERWLDALLFAHRRAPADWTLVQTIVGALEASGQPDRALEFLRATTDAPNSRERLELAADVAARAGRDDTRRALLAELTRRYGQRADWALALASFHFARGEQETAFRALDAATRPQPPAFDGHRDFWDAYAELARLTGRDELALATYRRLIASRTADEADYQNAAALLEARDPRQAAEIAEAAFARFGKPFHALQALALRVRAGDAAGAHALLARLTPEQRALLERDARFLAQRASFLLAHGNGLGDARGAAADARRAVALEPNDAELRALLLWSLLAARDAGALRAQLDAWSADAREMNELVAPFAAGWLALQQPRKALPWLRRQAQADRNGLWLLGWADAMEQLGYAEQAWNARRHAWLALRQARPADVGRQRDIDARLVSLATTFAEGDAARARFDAMRAGAGADEAQARSLRDVALGRHIERGEPELAQAWLAARYADALDRPAWAQLSVALAHDDRAQLAHLLDTVADWLPLADRIEAAQRTGRAAEAQTVAFDGLLQRPDADELQRRFDEQALSTAVNASIAGNRFRQRPLAETLWSFDGSAPLTPRLTLAVQQMVAYRDSTDSAQFIAPADADITRALSLRFSGGGSSEQRSASLSLHQRDALDTVAGAQLQVAAQLAPRLRLAASAGSAQPATDTVYLRAGALRDVLAAAVAVRLSHRDFAALAVEASRFESQAGEPLGRGNVARFEIGHDFRTEYPDLSLRATAARLDYSADGGTPASMLPLLPTAAQPGATAATFMPRSTTQFGLTLAAGQSSLSPERFNTGTRRAWRPYALLAATDDRESGGSYEWRLGAGGSLLGADHLSIAAGGGSGLGVQRTPFTQVGVRYRVAF